MRRQLYARNGSAELLNQYLHAQAELQTARTTPLALDTGGREPVPLGEARRGAPKARFAICAAVACLLAVAAVCWWVTARASLPDRIDPPAAAGPTLLFYSRQTNPESAPDKVTFEPADDTLFNTSGRRLLITLRCVGLGTVRITAAEVNYFFHCDNRLQTLSQRSATSVQRPFLILGKTTGNVVWGMRITSPTGRS